MRPLRLQQGKVVALLFAGYGALYFCRADLSVGAPLIVDQLTRHGMNHDDAIVRIGTISSLGERPKTSAKRRSITRTTAS